MGNFQYGQQYDQDGNALQTAGYTGPWGKTTGILDSLPYIVEDLRALKDDRIVRTHFRGIYANVAALPSTGNSADDIAIVLDDGTNPAAIYRHTGSAWAKALDNNITAFSANNMRYIVHAAGLGITSTSTGTLKITLTDGFVDSRCSMKLNGFQNDSTAPYGAWELLLGGYVYVTSSNWQNASATVSPNSPFSSVRFGKDGNNKPCILIGTMTTAWKNCPLHLDYLGITNFHAGFTMEILANETGITVQSTPVLKTVETVNFDSGSMRAKRNAAGMYLTGSQTGTIKIALPDGYANSYSAFKVIGYNSASGNGAWEAIIGGNAKTIGTTWENFNATLSPNCPFTSVRFAKDGSNLPCILLGTTSSAWTDAVFHVGYVGTQNENNFAISLIASESGYTIQQTPVLKTLSVVNFDNAGARTKHNAINIFNNSVSATGTYKITVADGFTDTYAAFKISGYQYDSVYGAWEILVGGYLKSSGTTWEIASATFSPNCPFTSVRLGKDSSNLPVILLGTTATVWKYAPIHVTCLNGGAGTLINNVSIALIASETGLTVQLTPTVKKLIDNTIAGYALQAMTQTSWTPGDSSTYYFGSVSYDTTYTAAGRHKIVIPRAGIITNAVVYWTTLGTAGTGEEISIYIRLNNTTDTLIKTIAGTATDKIFDNAALGITVAQGDYLEFKLVTPAWVTNPTSVYLSGSLFISPA